MNVENERAEHKTRRTPETAGETRGYTTPTVLGSPSPGANLLDSAASTFSLLGGPGERASQANVVVPPLS